MRLGALMVFLFLVSCKQDTKESFKNLAGKSISCENFVNLYDTTQVLDKKTEMSIGFLNGRIYLFASVATEDINFQYETRDTCIWKDPCVEFFIDPGADGLDYYEMQFNAKPQVWDLKLKSSQAPVNAPENMLSWDIGDRFGHSRVKGTINDPSDKDEYWTLTAGIEWEKIAEGIPKKGDKWAYNFMRVDYDKNNEATYWVAKSTVYYTAGNPQ